VDVEEAKLIRRTDKRKRARKNKDASPVADEAEAEIGRNQAHNDAFANDFYQDLDLGQNDYRSF